MSGIQRKNVIEEKTFNFALIIIELYRICVDQKEYILAKQLLKSGTSIGANVREADAAQTKKDFITKMSIVSKESRETHYWIRLLSESKLVKFDAEKYLNKILEIIRLLTSIVKTAQRSINKTTKH